ncbi:OPT oligopeptide transporter protein-domain-containing protein [Lipomyces arxii]|uniref:OPT oligopeptide transporter protein-domain-containing protein n=1 Tax=Lipomyces arxii TaxID=56418 RepID=UPI0034CDEC3A
MISEKNEKSDVIVSGEVEYLKDTDVTLTTEELTKTAGEILEIRPIELPNIRERVMDRVRNGMSKDMEDLLDLGPQMDFFFDMMITMTMEEAYEVLTAAVAYHADDSNFPEDTMQKMQLLLEGEKSYGADHEEFMLDFLLEATMMKYHSPYPEVRAVCDPVDDITLPVETIRAYFLGIIWVAIGAFINQLFGFRQPSLYIGSTAIQILLYPCGKFLEKTLPDKGFTLFGVRHSLNPGKWNHKEQMLATLMVNVGSTSSNFMSYVSVMKLERFFAQTWISFGFMFLMNFSTQFFGFGLAGLLRRWVVYPAKAIWPSLLPTLMLNRTLLQPENGRSIHGWTMTKYKFFFIVLGCTLVYNWLPGYLFTALSTFNWMTWIAPQNKNLAIITGSVMGLGFNPFTTFDWGVINTSTPLQVPFFASLNQYIGMLFGGIIMIGLYYRNYKWMGYLPINSTGSFDNRGNAWNASRVVTSELTLNVEAYENYSPPFISLGYLVAYGSEFCMFTLAFIYICLSEWSQVRDAFKGFYTSLRYRKGSNFEHNHDAISKLMSRYPEVPDWWYLTILILSLVFGIVACQAFPTNTPAWSIIVVILVSIFLMIPSAIIMSTTGYQLGFNDIGIVIAGYMVPEHAIANMLCRVYGWNVDGQAETLIGDQKLGHYSKIPPRAQIRCQMLATIIQCFITIGAYLVLENSFPDLCSLTQSARFVCPFPNALYTATLVWGVVGPKRVFETLYPLLKWAFLIGVLTAAPVYYTRMYFFKYLKHFNPVLFLGGMGRFQSLYNLAYYTPGLQFSFVFMYYIRRHYLAWWTKYNYVLTSALSAGVAFGAILIFATVQVTNVHLSWWGKSVSYSGLDGEGTSTLFEVAEGEYFGPRSW